MAENVDDITELDQSFAHEGGDCPMYQNGSIYFKSAWHALYDMRMALSCDHYTQQQESNFILSNCESGGITKSSTSI